MNPTTLNSFFTLESIMSLQGATAASLLVPNVFGYLLGPSADKFRKWLALLVAVGLAFITAYLAPTQLWTKWVLAFFNSLLIFSSTVGINQMATTRKVRRGILEIEKTGFFISWF